MATVNGNDQYTATEKRKMYLSNETVEGLRMTGTCRSTDHHHIHVHNIKFVNVLFHVVKSFIEMTRFLLGQSSEGETLFLLSERISQDPLENYFGKQRSRGGRCDNPCIKECLHNAAAIRAQKSMELDRVQGNCCRKRRLEDCDMETFSKPLPKCKRKKTRV